MGVYSTAMPIAMTIISSNVGGFTKRATVSAVFFILYCVGNIIGPQLFFENEAPRYQVSYTSVSEESKLYLINTIQSGFLAIIICLSINVIDSGALMFYLRWENARREKSSSISAPDSSPEKHLGISTGELSDVTDLKNDKFRYVY